MPAGNARSRAVVKLALSLGTALYSGLAAPAIAQSIAPAPVRPSVDPNGVDLFSGEYRTTSPALVIGNMDETLSLFFTWTGKNWIFNNASTIVKTNATTYVVSNGDSSDRFTLSGGTFTSTEGDGSTLTFDGTTYRFRTSDGTVTDYTKAQPNITGYEAISTKIERPDGRKLLLFWDYEPLADSGGYAYRFGAVRNDGNYSIMVQYRHYHFYDVPADSSNFNDINYVYAHHNNVGGDHYAYVTRNDGLLAWTTFDSKRTEYRTSAGKLTSIQRPGSAAPDISVGYTGNRVASVTTPAGVTSYGASDAGNIRTVTVTNPASQTTTYKFDTALQRMTSMTDATNRTTSWQHDGAGRVTRITAQEGNYASFRLDGRGNVEEKRQVSKTPGTPPDIVTSATYESTCTAANFRICNQPITTTDARNGVTRYTYDAAHGGMLTVTSPAGASGVQPQTRYTYRTMTGPGTGETVYKLDKVSTCRATASCVGTADETRMTLDYSTSTLLPVSQTIAAGDGTLPATTAISYDWLGNLRTVDGPLPGPGDTTRLFYNASRQLTMSVGPDPDGGGALTHRAMLNGYDPKGRLSSVARGTANADGSGFLALESVHTAFDGADRKTSESLVTSGSTHAFAQYKYDAAGRLECATQRMKPSAFGGQPDACSLGQEGPHGPDRITKTEYDAAGRVTSVTSAYLTAAASADVTNAYTVNGQLQSVKDAQNNLTTYEYDGFDRLVKTRYPVTTPGANASSTTDYEQLVLDPNGNVTSRRLRDGNSIGFSYDALNRAMTKTLPLGEPAVAYEYDLLGRVKKMTRAGGTVTLSYDALGRLTSDAQPHGTMSYQYDPGGRRTRVTWGADLYVAYDYLLTGEVSAIRENGATSGVGVLAAYAYDDLGRRTRLTRGNGVVTTYGYGAASRLTELGLNLAGTAQDQTYTLTYNAAGQIASREALNDLYAWKGHYNVDRPYGVNGLNRLTTAGATPLGYDDRGNLIQSGAITYTYSSENQLKTASGPTASTLRYDAAGRLTDVDNGNLNRFVYDGGNMASQLKMVSGNYVMSKRYVWGQGADEAIMWYDGTGITNRTWMVTDERGSVVATANAAGTATGINTYDEYGIPGTGTGQIRYAGQAWISSIGLSYNKARMYSPTLGRFMQTDPIGYADGLNWYNYTGSDPVNKTDPGGETGSALDCYLYVSSVIPTLDGTFYGYGSSCRLPNPTGYDPFDRSRERRDWYGGGSDLAPSPAPVPTPAPVPQSEEKPDPPKEKPKPPLDCPTIVDLVAAGVLITGVKSGAGAIPEALETASILKELRILNGLKAGLVGSGVGLVALAGGSVAYYYARDQIVGAICKR